MTKPAKKPAPYPVEIFDDVAQGTDDWHLLKRGIPSASNFDAVLAEGRDGDASKTRAKYMRRLAGEILTGEIAETFKSEAMKRGNAMEPEALAWYERAHLVDLERVGFARRTMTRPLGSNFLIGCSPDAIVPKRRKAVEVKTMNPDLLIEAALKGAAGFPTEHRAQVQGTMLVLDYESVDLILFYRGWRAPLKFEVKRDDAYIAKLTDALERFDYELQDLVKRVKQSGKGW